MSTILPAGTYPHPERPGETVTIGEWVDVDGDVRFWGTDQDCAGMVDEGWFYARHPDGRRRLAYGLGTRDDADRALRAWLRLDEAKAEPEPEHRFTVTATGDHGSDSGRPRDRVECATCGVVVHPNTTGPEAMQRAHIEGSAPYEAPAGVCDRCGARGPVELVRGEQRPRNFCVACGGWPAVEPDPCTRELLQLVEVAAGSDLDGGGCWMLIGAALRRWLEAGSPGMGTAMDADLATRHVEMARAEVERIRTAKVRFRALIAQQNDEVIAGRSALSGAEAENARLRAAVRVGLAEAAAMPDEWRSQPTDYARGVVNGGESIADAIHAHLTADDLAALVVERLRALLTEADVLIAGLLGTDRPADFDRRLADWIDATRPTIAAVMEK